MIISYHIIFGSFKVKNGSLPSNI